MSADVDENFARVTNLGEGELDTPDLSLVTETVLARKLQFKLEPSNHSTPKNGRESHVSSPSSKNFPTPFDSLHCHSQFPCRSCLIPTHLELGVETGSLVGPLRDLVGLGLLPGRAIENNQSLPIYPWRRLPDSLTRSSIESGSSVDGRGEK